MHQLSKYSWSAYFLLSGLLQEEEVTERIKSSVEDPLGLGKSAPLDNDDGRRNSSLHLPLLLF